MPVFDAEVVTHIVTVATCVPTLLALGLKSLDDIPAHIPTVSWEWARRPPNKDVDTHVHEFTHAVFSERLHADSSKAPVRSEGEGKGNPSPAPFKVQEYSRIE